MSRARTISLQGLVKSFHGPDGVVPAVRAVDLSIEPGETVALLGPNGAGKSTTLDMLLGLSEPDAGAARGARRCVPDLRHRRCPRRGERSNPDPDDGHAGRVVGPR